MLQLNELKLALNLLRTNNLVHDVQFFDYHYGNICDHDGQQCQASCVVYKGITQLWEAIVCPKGEYEKWQKHACLFGNYPMCGVQKLTFYSKEMTRSYSNVIQWHRFALETIMVRNGQALKKLTLVYKTTTSNEFINYLKPKL